MNSATISRDEATRTIRTNLRRRGLGWVSVRGGRGTAWGWITICAMPSKAANEWGSLTPDQQAALASALGIEPTLAHQHVSIPASSAYYAEYIARSAGETPTVYGTRYWD
jgi:hypothetical protein